MSPALVEKLRARAKEREAAASPPSDAPVATEKLEFKPEEGDRVFLQYPKPSKAEERDQVDLGFNSVKPTTTTSARKPSLFMQSKTGESPNLATMPKKIVPEKDLVPLQKSSQQSTKKYKPTSDDPMEEILSYFGREPTEDEKAAMEWMQPVVPKMRQEETKITTQRIVSYRFDLSGNLLTKEMQESIPTHHGLHHHGNDPELAGYTILELLHLAKSTVPGQVSLFPYLGCD